MVIPARAAKLYERTWDRFNEMLSFISTMALRSLCKDSRVNYRGMQEWKEQHGYVEPEQADAAKTGRQIQSGHRRRIRRSCN